MDKIERYREVQKETFEDFFNTVVDKCICRYCDNYYDCLEYMGEENIAHLSGHGCAGFDTSVENVKEIFLKERKMSIGT